MPDTRQHRGPHPEDVDFFAEHNWPNLQAGVADLSWLLSHGYARPSALKLVGDRYELTERQRTAVSRSSCSDESLELRLSKRLWTGMLSNESALIDGFNLLITIEAALSNGIILGCRDEAYRDMASMHGNYRQVEESKAALELIGKTLAEQKVRTCRWLLDKPVSNSGRLKTTMLELADANGWYWTVELVDDPDAELSTTEKIVITSDSGILDQCSRWYNLARQIVDEQLPDVGVVPMFSLRR